MNLGTFLQTIITIVFIYLILALIASELQENIATIFELRAQRLKASIQKMFGEDEKILTEDEEKKTLTYQLYNHPNIKALNQSAYSWLSILGISFNYPSWKEWWGDGLNVLLTFLWVVLIYIVCFFREQLVISISIFIIIIFCRIISFKWIRETTPFNWLRKRRNDLFGSLRKKSWYETLREKQPIKWLIQPIKVTDRSQRKSIGPSYIYDSVLFAKTITSIIIKDGDKSENPVKTLEKNDDLDLKDHKMLKIFVNSSASWEEFETNLKRQYEEIQGRSSGVYKRNAKGLSFVVGFLVAFIANADALNIVNNLSKNNQDYTNKLVSKLEESTIISTRGDSAGKELTPEQRGMISTIVKDNEIGILPLGWDYDLELENQKLAKEKQDKENDDIEKDKLIEILDANKLKIESLGKKEGDCKDGQEDRCFDDLISLIKSNKQVVKHMDDNFLKQLKDRDKNKLPQAYATLREELKKEQRSKILEKPDGNGKQHGNGKQQYINYFEPSTINANVNKQGGWPRVLFGWFISAIAISMGAPFWFDLLGNIMNVRNSGKDFRKNRR